MEEENFEEPDQQEQQEQQEEQEEKEKEEIDCSENNSVLVAKHKVSNEYLESMSIRNENYRRVMYD